MPDLRRLTLPTIYALTDTRPSATMSGLRPLTLPTIYALTAPNSPTDGALPTTSSALVHEHIYNDTWAGLRSLLWEDTNLLTQILMGHLMTIFGTPATLTTWNKDIPRRINDFLNRVATTYPALRPSVVIRAIHVLIRHKQAHMDDVAYDDDAEVLFYVAFMQVAATVLPEFTLPQMLTMMCTPAEVIARFLRFEDCLLDQDVILQQGMTPEGREKDDMVKVVRFLEFYFAPFVSADVRRGSELFANEWDVVRCPTIPESSPYGGWDSNDNQKRVLPSQCSDKTGSIVQSLSSASSVSMIYSIDSTTSLVPYTEDSFSTTDHFSSSDSISEPDDDFHDHGTQCNSIAGVPEMGSRMSSYPYIASENANTRKVPFRLLKSKLDLIRRKMARRDHDQASSSS